MFWTSKWTTKCNVVFTFSTCICIVWAWAVCLCQSILEDSEKSRWVLYIALSVGHSEENENKYPMSHGQSNVKLKAKISNFGKKNTHKKTMNIGWCHCGIVCWPYLTNIYSAGTQVKQLTTTTHLVDTNQTIYYLNTIIHSKQFWVFKILRIAILNW